MFASSDSKEMRPMMKQYISILHDIEIKHMYLACERVVSHLISLMSCFNTQDLIS